MNNTKNLEADSFKSVFDSPVFDPPVFDPPRVSSARWFGLLAVIALAVGSTVAIYALRQYLRQPLPSLSLVEQTSALTTTEFIGKVQPAMTSKIAALSPGIVRDIYVQVGDRVKANQPLLVLENPDVVQGYSQLKEQQAIAQQQIAQLKEKLAVLSQQAALMRQASAAENRLASTQLQSDLVPLHQRQDSVERARASYDLAATQFRRVASLYQEGAISQSERDRAQADLRIATADLHSAQQAAAAARTLEQEQSRHRVLTQDLAMGQQQQQQIALQQQLEVAQLQYQQVTERLNTLREQWAIPSSDAATGSATGSNMDSAADSNMDSEGGHFQMIVRATQDGVISDIPANRGDQILTGTALAELSQIDQLNIEVAISARLINSLSIGQRASVQIGTEPNTRTFTARIVTINPLPSDDLTHQVSLRIDNPSYQLLVGQPAKVHFEDAALSLEHHSP